MEHHLLDRPIWSSLASSHARFSRGGDGARRFLDDISELAGIEDESAESLERLADLVPQGGGVVIAQANDFACPPGLSIANQSTATQMVYHGTSAAPAPRHPIVRLTSDDEPEMLALAILTKPGPYLAGSARLGSFFGVRREGRLIAMAGERLRQPGFTEVSAVCTHPDARGEGLAAELCRTVVGQILERGETPYLHAYTSNTNAARLYEKLGFKLRRTLQVKQLTKP